MKESEFIQLLNLYLDHELSAADAARLEAEVQANPARRKIYQQYCRMQKACKLAASEFHVPDEQPDIGSRKVVAFDQAVRAAQADRQRRVNRFYTIGTLVATAACIAIVIVGRSRQAENRLELSTGAPAPVARVEGPSPAPAMMVAASAPRALGQEARREAAATLVGNNLLLTGNAQAEAVYAAALQQANNQLAWIEAVQLTPVQPRQANGDLHFDATLRSESRALGQRSSSAGRSEQPAEEMVTWQFRK